MDRRLRISNHHGDVENPNNLKAAKRVIEQHGAEIDIYEIDFVSVGNKIISSHDYIDHKIKRGSKLSRWIDLVVVEHRRILWIDVKENLAIFMACAYGKFNADALFSSLDRSRRRIMRDFGFDILHYIWIGCQDLDLRSYIHRTSGEWRVIMDMPSVTNYIWQYATLGLAKGWLCRKVCQEFKESDYKDYDVVTIDQSFFFTRKDIKKFIMSLDLDPSIPIVINSFDRDVKPIKIRNHHIIMQYNYTTFLDV
jgi:hypothetical protein